MTSDYFDLWYIYDLYYNVYGVKFDLFRNIGMKNFDSNKLHTQKQIALILFLIGLKHQSRSWKNKFIWFFA